MIDSECFSLLMEDWEVRADKQRQRRLQRTVLYMLDKTGKLLEKLIKSRLTDTICAAGDFSPKQNGFGTGQSTIDAIEELVQTVRLATVHSRHCRRVVFPLML